MRDIYMVMRIAAAAWFQPSPELIMTTRSPRLILPSVVQRHRDAGRAGVTPLLHDGMAFLEWHVAPLGRYRDGRLADLSEDQLIHLVCGEATFVAQALE